MKILLTLFVLLFSSSVLADDISDFEIEGISIGDSALDSFSEKQIKENEFAYSNKKYKRVQNDNLPFFNTYDAVDFNYKTGDKKYIIHNLSGILLYKHNVEDCYPKMDLIINDLKNNFNPIEFLDKETFKHQNDPTGKSVFTDAVFRFKSGDIVVTCYDYSEAHDNTDHLSVSIDTIEFNNWLIDEAYK